MQTPVKTSSTSNSGVTSTSASPLRNLGRLRFPTGFPSEREFPVEPDSSTCLISAKADKSLLELFIDLNQRPECCRFFRIKTNLYFEDVVEANEGMIHEGAVSYFTYLVNKYQMSMHTLLGHDILAVSTGLQLRGGVPDLAITLLDLPHAEANPNFIIEVSYGVTLRLTHEKIQQYFREIPGLMGAWILRIDYPWARIPDSPFYDLLDGRMVVYKYRRDFANGQQPESGLSFGGMPLSEQARQSAQEILHMEEYQFHGYGVRDEPPCNALGLPLYDLIIPGDFLLNCDFTQPQSEIANATRQYIFQLTNGDIDLHVDLFALKVSVLRRGVGWANSHISSTSGEEAPPLPAFVV